MIRLRNLPIKSKLIAMMMLAASIGILAMAIAISINEAMTVRGDIESELATLAKVIGSRSTGSLAFNDPKTAIENLTALSMKRDIVYAAIFQEEGRLFAEYKPDLNNTALQQTAHMTWPNQILPYITAGKLPDTISVSSDIYFENQRVGKVQVIADMSSFLVKMSRYLSWVFISLLACFTLSLVVSARLHKLISTPILNLQKVTGRVSVSDDYSVRIPNQSNDELGHLIDSFNAMLEQLEIRDQKLAEYSRHLESLVDERTDELTESNNRRIQWLENMARFLKHELKNSSVGIKSSLELIRRRSEQPSIDVYLDRADKSLNYMNVLLTSVSNASNLEAMIYKEALSPLNMADIVKAQVDEYKLSYPQFTLVAVIDSNTRVMGNEDRLKQLLDNLVNNAFDHCLNNTPIAINLRCAGENVELSVINEGVKLPADKEKMFDLFVSLREAGQWKGDNLGLGLYLVKLIAEWHDGTVSAQDLPEKDGAIFTVSLPLLRT